MRYRREPGVERASNSNWIRSGRDHLPPTSTSALLSYIELTMTPSCSLPVYDVTEYSLGSFGFECLQLLHLRITGIRLICAGRLSIQLPTNPTSVSTYFFKHKINVICLNVACKIRSFDECFLNRANTDIFFF